MWLISAATPIPSPKSQTAAGQTFWSGERTWPSPDIVKGELGDARVELHQERQRLTNDTGRAQDGDFGELHVDENNRLVSVATAMPGLCFTSDQPHLSRR